MITYTQPRSDWEDPNLTIAAHTSSPAFPWSTADHVAIHYTAADRIPNDVARYLRSVQNYYVTVRGYSIGYSAAVDQRGRSWELRGTDWRAAANRNWNNRTFVILELVDGDDPANPAMIAETQRLIGQFVAQSPLAQHVIVGHRDIGQTTCPGDGIYAQIQTGVFDPPEEETTVYFARLEGDPALYLFDGMFARWVPNPTALAEWADEFSIDPNDKGTIPKSQRKRLKRYVLVGPQPQYTGLTAATTTSAADFGAHVA